VTQPIREASGVLAAGVGGMPCCDVAVLQPCLHTEASRFSGDLFTHG
jgi:hypothetical protein